MPGNESNLTAISTGRFADGAERLISLPMAYVFCQLTGWGVWAIIGALFSSRATGLHYGLVLFSYGLFSASGFITSHLLRYVMRRRRWLQLRAMPAIARIVAAVFVCVMLMIASLYFINIRLLHLFDPGVGTAAFLEMVAINTCIVYGIWMTIYTSVHSSRRGRQAELASLRMELALRDAQYRSLSAQVNPHFLFNSLNSLRALILIDPQKAITAVTHLSGVLRYSLAADITSTKAERIVPLRDELDAVSDYLALERIRFEDRLRVTQQIDPAALNICVPRMMVQHLVENAVKHGIAQVSEGGEVHIAAIVSEYLHIKITNPGHIAKNGNGTGLDNTRQRLRFLYGPSGTADCTLEENNGIVTASLTIPLVTTAELALGNASTVVPNQTDLTLEPLHARPACR
ncbi:MAG TPA: histidine kinase [Granulicella sp.]|jgi:LytS/YehU family sensor histidine kinase